MLYSSINRKQLYCMGDKTQVLLEGAIPKSNLFKLNNKIDAGHNFDCPSPKKKTSKLNNYT